MNIHIDSFSGSILDLKPKQRTRENALAVLRKDPRVSTFDMSKAWLERLLRELEVAGLVDKEILGYPWYKYVVTEKGTKLIEQSRTSEGQKL